jgi:hypothetical protein
MTLRRGTRYVIGPDGGPLTHANLPPGDTRRWPAKQKARVVAAVRGGLLTVDEARDRYRLTLEEYLSWQRAMDRHGLRGLRATHIQDYRENEQGKPRRRSSPKLRRSSWLCLG